MLNLFIDTSSLSSKTTLSVTNSMCFELIAEDVEEAKKLKSEFVSNGFCLVDLAESQQLEFSALVEESKKY